MKQLADFPYLACVKFELVNKEFLPQFSEYIDAYILDAVDKAGRLRGWRTQEDRNAPNAGFLNQEFWQIYQLDDPEIFRDSMPKAGPAPKVTERFPFARDLSHWGRTYYRILAESRKEAGQGGHQRYWARFEFDLNGAAEDEHDYVAEYERAVGGLLALGGVHEARLLRYVQADTEVGDRPDGKYMLLLEIDSPDSVFDREQDTEKPALAAVLSIRNAQSRGRHFSRLLLSATRNR